MHHQVCLVLLAVAATAWAQCSDPILTNVLLDGGDQCQNNNQG